MDESTAGNLPHLFQRSASTHQRLALVSCTGTFSLTDFVSWGAQMRNACLMEFMGERVYAVWGVTKGTLESTFLSGLRCDSIYETDICWQVTDWLLDLCGKRVLHYLEVNRRFRGELFLLQILKSIIFLYIFDFHIHIIYLYDGANM